MNRPYCKICGYEHKVRPTSFCIALNSKGGLMKNLNKDEFLSELITMHRSGKL